MYYHTMYYHKMNLQTKYINKCTWSLVILMVNMAECPCAEIYEHQKKIKCQETF